MFRRITIAIVSVALLTLGAAVCLVAPAGAVGRDAVPGQRIRGTDCVLVANPTPASHTNCPGTVFPNDLDLAGADFSHANLPFTRWSAPEDESGLSDNGTASSEDEDAAVASPRVNLTGAKFIDANLFAANFRRAIFASADMTRADLRGATLKHVHAGNSVFVDTGLGAARFCDADLTGANLASSDELQERASADDDAGFDLRKRFVATQFDRSNLSGAKLTSSFLNEASFKDAVLDGTDFSWSTFVSYELVAGSTQRIAADLSRLDLRTAILEQAGVPDSKAIFSHTDARLGSVGANLSGANLASRSLRGFDLRAVNFAGANMTNVDVSGGNLGNSNLDDVDATSASFSGADLSDISALGARFDYANLSRSLLRNATLARGVQANPADRYSGIIPDLGTPKASFRHAQLQHAQLTNTHPLDDPRNGTGIGIDFSHTDMTHTRITGTNFTGARLYGAAIGTLRGPNLQRATFMPFEPIAAGHSHTCALERTGHVYCWGNNRHGELGQGRVGDSTDRPVQVVGVEGRGYLDNITAITSGADHTCALDTHGRVYCWGLNFSGELGDGTNRSSATPKRVLGLEDDGVLTGITAISAGASHSCALNSGGTVYCWGSNDEGQLGHPTVGQGPSSVPIWVATDGGHGALTNVIAISSSTNQSCALHVDGHIHCWGENIGVTPERIHGFGGGRDQIKAIAISCGARQSCAIASDGSVYCWGANNGQVGNSANVSGADRQIPTRVAGVNGSGHLTDVAVVTSCKNHLYDPNTDPWHTCALDKRGQVFCWGQNGVGQLGDGTTNEATTPVQVAGVQGHGYLGDIVAITCGARHSCAVNSQGQVYCWGSNTGGHLGSQTRAGSLTPVALIDMRETRML